MGQMFDGFHVVCVVSNPCEYQSRYNLYKIFEEDIARKGGKLWTVELQTGARPARITQTENWSHIQLWSSALPGELWHKENLINLGIQHLTRENPDWRYVAWIDADIKFEAGALEKTVQALQHWDIVQMWSHAVDFGPAGELLGQIHKSFMYCYWKKIPVTGQYGYLTGGHPGFAWAARRDALNKIGNSLTGPIYSAAILGSGDRHMAHAFVGTVAESFHPKIHNNYKKWLNTYQDSCERYIKRNVGYVENTIRHMWHGRKADRQYASRWKILVEHQFDPEIDLAMDVSGVWRLVIDEPRQRNLRDDIRRYFRARREDATTE